MWDAQQQDFGWALERLRTGERVSRRGWNAKGMWLMLVPQSALPITIGKHEAKMLSYVVMKTATGEFVPWLASQTDLLSFDWEEISLWT